MPSKKKKYNARFPAGRIKKIMQTDEEVGKVAQAVPIIISRTLELFVESLLIKSMQITQARSAKTLTPSHMKQCILSESRFDFLKDLVKNIPDPSAQEDNENNEKEILDFSVYKPTEDEKLKSPTIESSQIEQGPSASRIPVIQYGPKVVGMEQPKLNFSVDNLVQSSPPPLLLTSSSTSPVVLPQLISNVNNKNIIKNVSATTTQIESIPNNVPPLIPLSHGNFYGPSSGESNLYIDEDYDN